MTQLSASYQSSWRPWRLCVLALTRFWFPAVPKYSQRRQDAEDAKALNDRKLDELPRTVIGLQLNQGTLCMSRPFLSLCRFKQNPEIFMLLKPQPQDSTQRRRDAKTPNQLCVFLCGFAPSRLCVLASLREIF
jgi:hypothetical protein